MGAFFTASSPQAANTVAFSPRIEANTATIFGALAHLIAHGFDRIRRGAGKSGKNYLAAFDLHGVFEQSFNAHIGNFMLQRFNFLFFFLQLRGDGLRLLRQLRRAAGLQALAGTVSSASS